MNIETNSSDFQRSVEPALVILNTIKYEEHSTNPNVEQQLLHLYQQYLQTGDINQESQTSFINGLPTPTYTYSVLNEPFSDKESLNSDHSTGHVSCEDPVPFTFMGSTVNEVDQTPQSFEIMQVSSSVVSEREETNWFNQLLTPIESLSYDLDQVCTPDPDVLYSDLGDVTSVHTDQDSPYFHSASFIEESETIQHFHPKTLSLSNTLLSSPTIPYSYNLIPQLEEAIFSVIDVAENTTKKSTSKGSSRITKTRRKKPRSSPVLFDESGKSKAEQLRENNLIWEKILQTKKKGIYKCAHCSDIFSDLYQFANHIDVYKVVRPYKCPFDDCPWSILGLPKRAEVKRHCATQHQYRIPTSDEPTNEIESTCSETFACGYAMCQRFFRRKDSFKRHEKLVHLNPVSRFNKRIKSLKEKFKTTDMNVVQEMWMKQKIRASEKAAVKQVSNGDL